jgi:hypothetical protein
MLLLREIYIHRGGAETRRFRGVGVRYGSPLSVLNSLRGHASVLAEEGELYLLAAGKAEIAETLLRSYVSAQPPRPSVSAVN